MRLRSRSCRTGLLEPIPSSEPTDGWDGDRPLRVGTFGNLVADKGVDVLVDAMVGVRRQHAAGVVELHMHGRWLDESLRAAVRNRAQGANLLLVDHGPYHHGMDAAHPASGLDLAVFPSLCEETYGLVVEEALARRVPVIVSDLGALAERIGEGGMVTPAGDEAALARAILDLLDDPARYRALRSAIPDEFASIEDAARRYLDLYRRR